eukprot:5716028-Lingulodinium_polyedra.AAC.1
MSLRWPRQTRHRRARSPGRPTGPTGPSMGPAVFGGLSGSISSRCSAAAVGRRANWSVVCASYGAQAARRS